MTRDTRIALFLMGVLVTALRDNGPNPIKRSMSGDVHDQGDMWWRNYCWIAPLVPDRGKAGQPAGLLAAAAHRLEVHAVSSKETLMSKARDLINAHLYPVLATFAVVYGSIQITPIAQQARDMNACVKRAIEVSNPEDAGSIRANAVAACNGVPGNQRLFER